MGEKSLENSRILVVEDDYFLADELATELRKVGAVVVGPAGRVENALALISAEAPCDGGILDINLHGETVFPVADELAERGIPFIFVTGYDQIAIPARYQHILHCDKPVDVRKVIQALG